ncbi:MAG: hypothetical protein WAO19_10245 [Candidatus Kryptoniota bacterium]
MTDDNSTYSSIGKAAKSLSLSLHESVSSNVSSLVSAVSILILLLLSEGNILLGIIS